MSKSAATEESVAGLHKQITDLYSKMTDFALEMFEQDPESAMMMMPSSTLNNIQTWVLKNGVTCQKEEMSELNENIALLKRKERKGSARVSLLRDIPKVENGN